MEAAFAEFRGCRQHGQVTVSCKAETSTAAEVRRRYTQTCWEYAGPAPRTQLNVDVCDKMEVPCTERRAVPLQTLVPT